MNYWKIILFQILFSWVFLQECPPTDTLSIEPFQDCCSFFVPAHPETKADFKYVCDIEEKIDFGNLIESALANSSTSVITHKDYQKQNADKLEAVLD